MKIGKKYIEYDSIYIKFKDRQNFQYWQKAEERFHPGVANGLEGREAGFLGVGMFCILTQGQLHGWLTL